MNSGSEHAAVPLVPRRTVEPAETEGGSCRVRPAPGHPLVLADIQGPWHACIGSYLGIFGVAWGAPPCGRWAPLHDFQLMDQLRLIEACASHDREYDPRRIPSLRGRGGA